MNARLPLLLSIMLAIISLHTFADPVDKSSELDRLMELSGLNAQISQIPAQIEMGMSQSTGGSNLTADELAKLDKIMRKVFTAESLRKDVRQHLNDHMDKNTITESLVWLDSPLGKKITILDTAASSPESLAEMQQQLGELVSRAERVNAVQRLDSAVGATDAIIGMSTNVAVAISLPMIMSLPADQQPPLDTLVATISEQMELQRPNYKPIVLMTFLYAYQSLTDEELEQFITYAESPAGRTYHAVTFEALNHAFINHGKKLGELFTDSLQVSRQNI